MVVVTEQQSCCCGRLLRRCGCGQLAHVAQGRKQRVTTAISNKLILGQHEENFEEA